MDANKSEVKARCKTCAYFNAGTTYGECRRHAPKPHETTSPGWVWPVVGASSWCGEWYPAEDDALA